MSKQNFGAVAELLKKQQEDLKRYEDLEKICQKIAETAQKELRRQKIKTWFYVLLAAAAAGAAGYGIGRMNK